MEEVAGRVIDLFTIFDCWLFVAAALQLCLAAVSRLYSLIGILRLLMVVAALVAQHRLWAVYASVVIAHELSSCGSQVIVRGRLGSCDMQAYLP